LQRGSVNCLAFVHAKIKDRWARKRAHRISGSMSDMWKRSVRQADSCKRISYTERASP
jgi:hypothetical protein